MGLFGIFGNKKLIDKLNKYFYEKKIELKAENDKYSFEIVFHELGYSLFPYFKLSEASNEISIVINVRKCDNVDFNMLNSFNLKSKYFTAKASNNVIYLEYTTSLSNDTYKEVLNDILNSLTMLAIDIDNL